MRQAVVSDSPAFRTALPRHCRTSRAEFVRQNIRDVDQMRNDHDLTRLMEMPKGRIPQSMWRMNALAS